MEVEMKPRFPSAAAHQPISNAIFTFLLRAHLHQNLVFYTAAGDLATIRVRLDQNLFPSSRFLGHKRIINVAEIKKKIRHPTVTQSSRCAL